MLIEEDGVLPYLSMTAKLSRGARTLFLFFFFKINIKNDKLI